MGKRRVLLTANQRALMQHTPEELRIGLLAARRANTPAAVAVNESEGL
jgi:hypothetical protein